ncbi:MAG: PEP-CTERM sorting domain-containing protein [Pirellulaceae bacterium]|nr:PEP-CTERM sorting domain-containing protein [Pirellulaceae bacterium]
MRQITKKIAVLLLCAAVMTFATASVQAANLYWDTSTDAGYQPGDGNWATDAYWTLNGTTLQGWGGASDYAYLQAAGTSNIALGGASVNRAFFDSKYGDSLWNISGNLTSNRIYVDTTVNDYDTTVNMSSGYVTVADYFRIGTTQNLKDSISIFNLSGGTVEVQSLNGIALGSQSGTSELNISGGKLTNSGYIYMAACSNDNQILTASLTLSGTGIAEFDNTSTIFELGRNSKSTSDITAIINLNVGGTLSTSRSITQAAGQTLAAGIFNFNGGTFKALDGSNATWIDGLAGAGSMVQILDGGALIDTNSYDMGITEALVTDGVGNGGLTKLGLGKLTLSGYNTYTGDTLVDDGTLSLAEDCLVDNSAVWIDANAVLDLTHSLTDTVGALYFDGVAQAPGIYNAANSGGFISGTGSLQVVPEPSTLALLACGLFGLIAYAWKKRK